MDIVLNFVCVCVERRRIILICLWYFLERTHPLFIYILLLLGFFFLIKKIATPLKPYFNATLYTFISSITILTTTILLPLDIDTFEK